MPVFPVKFQLKGFVPLTNEKWGYKKKQEGQNGPEALTWISFT